MSPGQREYHGISGLSVGSFPWDSACTSECHRQLLCDYFRTHLSGGGRIVRSPFLPLLRPSTYNTVFHQLKGSSPALCQMHHRHLCDMVNGAAPPMTWLTPGREGKRDPKIFPRTLSQTARKLTGLPSLGHFASKCVSSQNPKQLLPGTATIALNSIDTSPLRLRMAALAGTKDLGSPEKHRARSRGRRQKGRELGHVFFPIE